MLQIFHLNLFHQKNKEKKIQTVQYDLLKEKNRLLFHHLVFSELWSVEVEALKEFHLHLKFVAHEASAWVTADW